MKIALTGLLLLFSHPAFSQLAAPPAAAGSTGQCKDGSYTTESERAGACHGHKGVRSWYTAALPSMPVPTMARVPSVPAANRVPSFSGVPAATPGKVASVPAAAPVQSFPSVPAATRTPSVPSVPAASTVPAFSAVPAARMRSLSPDAAVPAPRLLRHTATAPVEGGGPGLVWVNTSTRVYHCPGSDFYGKTKTGAYMTEADATASGARPNRGKACS